MTMIRLHSPAPMSDLLQRLRLFPGRHLGEDELDRMQAYADERMAPLLAGGRPGIVHGLEVELAPRRALQGLGDGCLVRPGLAVDGNGGMVGLFYEARATWCTLVTDWLRESQAGDAAGVYYLVLRRFTGLVDADQGIDPCRRTELDPRRDTRLEALGGLALRRLALSAEAVAAMTPAQIQNRIAAMHLDGDFLDGMGSAVPLALLAVSPLAPVPADPDAFRFRVDWLSQAAGRYLAIPDSGYQVLLAQVQVAFRDALDQALLPPANPDAPAVPVADRLEQNLRLDFLPAAGVLPSVLLEDVAEPRPRLRWLPQHLAVDMVPVPEESVPELIERHLPRRVIDLRRPTGERLRLLLAVNEPDYRPDLLDFPQVDPVLGNDLYRYHMRAHDAWRDWRRIFDQLYRVLGTDQLSAAEVRALALPSPVPAPARPTDVYDRIIAQARLELPPEQGGPPYPYDQGPPAAPDFYQDWLVPPRSPLGVPPSVPMPQEDGLVIRYRVKQVEMEALDNQIRALRARVEKTRDYLLLQRQQLDAQTVSLAALGGGVAGDGAGLQVARWLPFTKLKLGAEAEPQAFTEVGAAVNPAFMASATPAALASVESQAGVFRGQPAHSSAAREVAFSAPGAAKDFAFTAPSAAIKGISASSLVARGRASSVELGLRQDLLDRLGAAPKQLVTEPAIQGRTYQFGVLDNIQAEVREYEAAYRGMRDLIATLDSLFERAEASAIRTALEGFGTPVTPNQLAAELKVRPYPLGLNELSRVRELRDRLIGPDQARARGLVDGLLENYNAILGELEIDEGTLEEEATTDTKRRFEALFKAGQILTRQIAYMEDRYNRIEDALEARLRDRIRMEGMLDKLAALIEEAGRRLAGIDGRRVERLGDYGVAQGLTREDWARVYRDDRERTRVLTVGLKGLYYVRVRETPISARLADPLALRHGTPQDPVPGCDWDTEVDVPAALTDFFDAVLEVPIGDWRALIPLMPKLPPERVPDLFGLRRFRFGQRQSRVLAARTGAQLGARLQTLVGSTRALYQTWSVAELPASKGARGRWLADVSNVLSLADLLGVGAGAPQRQAQELHNRLEQCIVCLMDRLGVVAPSLRFEWAQLAEDDRLDTERPESWPGLERAEAGDFNALRTLTELVAWWFRQLDEAASAAGRGALRNLIRAAVIVSAHGDPNEILQGQVLIPPRRLAVGEPVRLALNRSPVPGTRLQMMDEAQRVVGMLAVSDQDDRGTIAQVVRVDDAITTVTTRFTVVATRATQQMG